MKAFLLSIIATGCSLSAVAAFYSIGGLVKIFKGNETSIIILACALETAKVLISIYLHIYWNAARRLLVGYLTFALVILAFITSLGIFGALSSAYFNSTDTEQLNTKISIIQSQIEIEQSKIKNGMSQISAIASIPKEEKQSWHYYKINTISKEIDGYTKNIDEHNDRLMPLKAELNRMNTEVGPLRYLAGWIYGELEDATDRAVQLFIVMMVTVFDPLALLLIFAGIHAFEIERAKLKPLEELETIEPISVIKSEYLAKEPAVVVHPGFAELTKEDVDRLLAFLGKKVPEPVIEPEALPEDFFNDELVLYFEDEPSFEQPSFEEINTTILETTPEIIEQPVAVPTTELVQKEPALKRWLKKKLKKKIKRKPTVYSAPIPEEIKKPEKIEKKAEKKPKQEIALEDGEEEVLLHTNNSRDEEENISTKDEELKNINYHN